MEYFIIATSAFLISALTLFSGFGIGTVLTPVFALFFPVPIAISITAIVHFLNNVFKLFLVGSKGSKEVVLKFGIPAIIGAIFGAKILSFISHKSFTVDYQIFNHQFHVELVSFVIGLLIMVFAMLEILPYFDKASLPKKYLPMGGVISGFFGGLSGNQGAFRSLFLLKAGISKEQFIATGVIIAVMVDITRLSIYGTTFLKSEVINNLSLLTLVVLSAFLGSFLASKFLHKIAIDAVKLIVFGLLFIIAIGLITGMI